MQNHKLSHQIILELVPVNTKILDLGCGDGTLLSLLKDKECSVQGIEIDPSQVQICLSKGLPVVQQDIDDGFRSYRDNSFDYVLLNKTLQATHHPLLVMKEAVRVGKKVIVAVPNFAYYVIRWQLLTGHMPKSNDLPYEWYDTPNIHLVTVADFVRFCDDNNLKILQKIFYNEKRKLSNVLPNLLAPYSLFVLTSS